MRVCRGAVQVSVHAAATEPFPGAKVVARAVKHRGQQQANSGGGGGVGQLKKRHRRGQPPPAAEVAEAAHWPGGLVVFTVYHKTGFAMTHKIMAILASRRLVTSHPVILIAADCFSSCQGV
jgi:hypothetical protein